METETHRKDDMLTAGPTAGGSCLGAYIACYSPPSLSCLPRHVPEGMPMPASAMPGAHVGLA